MRLRTVSSGSVRTIHVGAMASWMIFFLPVHQNGGMSFPEDEIIAFQGVFILDQGVPVVLAITVAKNFSARNCHAELYQP